MDYVIIGLICYILGILAHHWDLYRAGKLK